MMTHAISFVTCVSLKLPNLETGSQKITSIAQCPSTGSHDSASLSMKVIDVCVRCKSIMSEMGLGMG